MKQCKCCLITSVQPLTAFYHLHRDLHICPSLCNWTLGFLSNRPQSVQIVNVTSSTWTLNTGAHHGIKFVDGCITDNDEAAYREEVEALTSWCKANNLLLNVSKTKELIVDFGRLERGGYGPIHTEVAAVETVSCFRFVEINISEDLSWSCHTDIIIRSVRQRLLLLQRLRRFVMDTRKLINFYRSRVS